MLTPRKKMTRKELHTDPLLSKVAQVSELAQSYKQYLSYALIALIVIVASTYGYVKYRNEHNSESINKLSAGERAYMSGDFREAIRKLEKYCAEYEGTVGGGIGTFYLANAYFNTDQFDFAKNHYQIYVDDYGDNELFNVASMMGLAACYEGLNNYKEAATQYEKSISKMGDSYLKPDAMMSTARCYRMLNQSEQAKQWYTRVSKEFPESTYSREAKNAIDELGGA